MKKYILGLTLGLTLATAGSVLASSPSVNCTVSGTPSSIVKGVPTVVTFNYTTSGANTLLIDSFAQSPAQASGTFTRTISQATRIVMVAYDNATGNAHLCVASITSTSHSQPN